MCPLENKKVPEEVVVFVMQDIIRAFIKNTIDFKYIYAELIRKKNCNKIFKLLKLKSKRSNTIFKIKMICQIHTM